MASMQQKKADSNGENMQQVIQRATIVTVNNKGSRPITLGRHQIWNGNPIDHFPEVVPPQAGIKLTHVNGLTASTGGFQYNGYTISGVPCGLVVAWDAPSVYNPPDIPNRVFTYGSSKEFADKNTWQNIVENLAKSSSTAVHGNIVHQEPDTANLIVDVNFDNWF